MTLLLEIELVILALCTAGAVLWGWVWLERRHKRAPVSAFGPDAAATVFLFDGEALIDSTPSARALLGAIPGDVAPWPKLLAYLVKHFPKAEETLSILAQDGAQTLTSAGQAGRPLVMQAELNGGLTRIVLSDPERDHTVAGQDLMAQRAMEEELVLLRDTSAKAPVLIWQDRGDGDIIWANTAYMLAASAQLAAHQDLTWPLPRLFDTMTPVTETGPKAGRHRLAGKDGGESWYDVVSHASAEGRVHFATLIDATVKAEQALRDFMVTLTKTFAHLHVGLAIFDQHRQLILFNPALMDLTGLPADFLTMRPSLLSVLDAMRERNMIPEPKDYRAWRRQLTEMERAASSGLYEETWSLPGGQTYRVIGRPHPNGAIALIFEDISSEMIRTRRFRADLEISQSVMDQLDEAIAVFSPSGQLVMSNDAYARLWGTDPAANLSEATLRSLSTIWRDRCAPTEVWSDLEEFASQSGTREAWSADLRLQDGRILQGRFMPLAGGATMTGFRLRDTGTSRPRSKFKEPALRSA